ncbi:MAG TPA: hypothetical protein VFI24_02325 [Pyrinomonadaceae bacterium]|nr:hypothetical protein [Pyrinomonadaceae bacterium]
MKKYLLLTVIMVLLASLAPARTEGQASTEEYAVYSAVIANMFPDEKRADDSKDKVIPLVILNVTGTDRPRPKEVQGELYFKQMFPTLPAGVAQDYNARNNEPARLKESFDLKLKYILVDDKEIKKIFDVGRNWEEFYKRYPGSRGFILLSRVGFNAEMNQALVYIQHSCGGLCGTGNYMLLEKKDDRWQVVKRSMAWIA